MPKDDRLPGLLPHHSPLRVSTWTLAILDDQPAELTPPRLYVPICMWHFHRSKKKGTPMSVDQCRLTVPGFLHAI